MNELHRILAALALAGTVGCGADDDERLAPALAIPTTRDSSGIVLHEHEPDVLSGTPFLHADTTAPILRIGGSDSAVVEVSEMFAFTLLADGALTAHHRRTGEVVFVDRTGAIHARHGNTDSDDGRFGLVVTLAPGSGDTAVVTDLMRSRIQHVVPGAGVVGSWIAVLRDSTEFHAAAGRLADGTWLLRPGYLTGANPKPAAAELPPRRPPLAIGRWREGGDLTRFDTLVLVPGWETVRARIPVNGRMEWADLHPQYAARPHAVAWQGEAAVITNDEWAVRRYDADGTLRSIIRINAPLRTVTDSVRRHLVDGMRRAAAAEWAGHVDSVRRVTEVDSLVDAMVFADSIAPFERMHLAPGRRLWLQETAIAPGDPARLIGFEPDGSIVGRLEVPLPPGGQVAAMGDDRVVVRVTVPEGKSYVVVWRIVEPR